MTRKLQIGGIRWHLADGVSADSLLDSAGLRLPWWLTSGQASLVKERPQRSVFRVVLPEMDFYVKQDKAAGSAWLRRLVQAGSARAEFERGVLLARRAVPTPEPLAFGESKANPRRGYLLTRTLPDSVPLDAFLERDLPTFSPERQTRLRQRIAIALGNLLAQMHDAGVTHRDLHPGNLLLQLDREERPRLWLIDLHAVHIGGPLGRAASYANLVILNRWFMPRSNRSDRLRCWLVYRKSRRHASFQNWKAESDRLAARRIERATLASNVRFWRNRDQRSLVSNRYFRRLRAGKISGHAVADLPADVFARFLADPDAPFKRPGCRLLKNSASSTVAALELPVPGGTLPIIYKRFAVTTWTDPWVALTRPTGALRSWVLGHGLISRFLPTPRPLAVFHRHCLGLPREGYLVMEKVSDALDLAEYNQRLASQPTAVRQPLLRDMLVRIGRLLGTLHQRQLSHRDLKAPNLLLRMDTDGLTVKEVLFIDLVGVRRHGKLQRRRRVQNLARLNASFRQQSGLTRTDKLRALRAYLAWGLHGRLGWKRWWNEIAAATEAKARRNQRLGRPLH
jgi:tRNA A-37 threonylcarbamoyl transferase component Bud32